MIVTIDGPAGAGKSSVAKLLAERIGFRFLDTGAMYRIVALAAIEANVALDDDDTLSRLLPTIQIDLRGEHAILNGNDVTQQIRRADVTDAVRHVADNLEVRAMLSNFQRQAAQGGNIVTEGRDQGTAVFPGAECKFFLTASPEERARRRCEQIRQRGEDADVAQVLAAQNQRDQHDEARPVGRLQQAEDAIVIVTDGMQLDEVIDFMEYEVRKRLPQQT